MRDSGVNYPAKRERRRRRPGSGSYSMFVACGVCWLIVAFATLSPVASADRGANATEDDISDCRSFHSSRPQQQMNLSFFTGTQGENFAVHRRRSAGGRWLSSYLSLHPLAALERDAAWTVLCVGLVDTTAYTREGAGDGAHPVAWATLHTLRQAPVGLVRLRSRCWLDSKHFKGCSPSFMPMPFMLNLPLYYYSPLEEEFWVNMTINALKIKEDWIWRINTQTNKGSIPADWIYNMNISSLQSLEIKGNNWKRPKRLLKEVPNVEILDLSYNNLEVVPKGIFENMPALQYIILGHNNISEYPQSVSKLTKLLILDLTNPIGNATLQISEDDIEQLPKTLRTLGLENTKLQSNVTHILLMPNLMFLNLSGCGVGEIIDQEIVISERVFDVIDLSGNNLRHLPQNIFTEMPKLEELILANNELEKWPNELLAKNSLTTLDLSHNNISNISSNTFSNFKKLQTLDLSWNHLEYLPDTMFQYSSGLVQINLSHNKLKSITPLLFSFTPELSFISLSFNELVNEPFLYELKLDTLDLSHNCLKSFANNFSSIDDLNLSFNNVSDLDISTIRKLNMSYNSMTYISPNLWNMITELNEVDMGGNNFECCQFEKRIYMNEPYMTKILNLGSKDPLTCSIHKTPTKILLESFVYNETECYLLGETEVKAAVEISIVIPIAVLFLSGALIAVAIYVYRFELMYISYLFRLKKAGGISDEQRYKTCVYDAFVCYSAMNFEWVTGTLLPTLEGGPEGYRLCVHDRDFALGAAINSNVVASLEKSRRVIFVLSRDFVASKWCQWELELANHKMFEEERNYIILVELERLQRSSLPRHLRYLMARTTYLEWPADTTGGSSGSGGPGDYHHRKMQHTCFRRLRDALGASLRQRTGRDNPAAFTVLDA